MKFKKKFDISPEFESLFEFNTKKDEIEHEAKMLMFKFLSSFEELFPSKQVKKTELASKIGTSPSFITQLYRGNKLVSLTTLAKLQDAYKFTYEIKAVPNFDYCTKNFEQYYILEPLQNKDSRMRSIWSKRDTNPNYNLFLNSKNTQKQLVKTI